jgi:hypothetical protein
VKELAAAPTATSEVTTLKLLCRGISRSGTANSDLAYSVRQCLTNNPTFTAPVVLGELRTDQDTNTFSFELLVDLRHHFKL